MIMRFLLYVNLDTYWATPNLADAKQPMVLIVQGEEFAFDTDVVASYREMVTRLASDPVGQTLVFELMIRLFFLCVFLVSDQRRSVGAVTRRVISSARIPITGARRTSLYLASWAPWPLHSGRSKLRVVALCTLTSLCGCARSRSRRAPR